MAAAQLRLLRVLRLELVTDAVQKLDVALLRVLLQSRNESPRHSSGSLPGNVRVLPGSHICQRMLFKSKTVDENAPPASANDAIVTTQLVASPPRSDPVGPSKAERRRKVYVVQYRTTMQTTGLNAAIKRRQRLANKHARQEIRSKPDH